MFSERPGAPWALALVVFLLALPLVWQATRWSKWTVTLHSETGGILKWYVDSGRGFSEESGGYVSVPAGERFDATVLLPSGGIERLRLDPVDSVGPVEIFSIRWSAPWPARDGWWDPLAAEWEGVDTVGRARGVVLEASGSPPDIRGVWNGAPGFSSAVWWFVRIGISAVAASIAFLLGRWWNLSLTRKHSVSHD